MNQQRDCASGLGKREFVKSRERHAALWKDNLRKKCLEKARKRRLEKLCEARRQTGVVLFQSDNNNSLSSASPADSGLSNEARSILRESLNVGEVSLHSSPHSPDSIVTPPHYINQPSIKHGFHTPIHTTSGSDNKGFVYHTPIEGHSYVSNDGYQISEQELLSLMYEVEEELQREETSILRMLDEAERNSAIELKMIEDQVAEYESWPLATEACGNPDSCMDTDEDIVWCPVCEQSNVIVTESGVILCRRYGLQRCSLRIDSHSEGMQLDTLKKMLYEVYAHHGSSKCCGRLHFEVRHNYGITVLHALCHLCNLNAIVV